MADLLKQRDQVIKSLDFVLEGMIQEIEKKSPSIPSKRPMIEDPLLPSGRKSIHWLPLPHLSKMFRRNHSLCSKLPPGTTKRGAERTNNSLQ